MIVWEPDFSELDDDEDQLRVCIIQALNAGAASITTAEALNIDPMERIVSIALGFEKFIKDNYVLRD